MQANVVEAPLSLRLGKTTARPLSCETKRFFVLIHPDESSCFGASISRSRWESDDVRIRCGGTTTHHIFLDIDCEYTRRIICEAFRSPARIDRFRVTLGPGRGMDAVPLPAGCHFQWSEYERIDWSSVLDGKHGASSYFIRKGLSRKAQLAYYTKRYTAKNPESVLCRALPETVVIDTWPAWDDHCSGAMNSEGLAGLLAGSGSVRTDNVKDRLLACLDDARRWMETVEAEYERSNGSSVEPIWILKGSTTNKGSGIYIIHVFEQLVDACWSDSDIREWVLQRYVASPLLLRKRKFHIRAYALAVSSIEVYLAQGALALCAGTRYGKNDFNKHGHVTNTAFQSLDPEFREDDCVLVWDAASIAPILVQDGTCRTLEEATSRIMGVTKAMQSITGELFRVYESEFGVFSPINGCFEHYGLDFLVDDRWNVYLLEVNPGPDFKQTGDRLSGVVRDLMSSTIDIVFSPSNGIRGGTTSGAVANGPRDCQAGHLVCVYANPHYRRSQVHSWPAECFQCRLGWVNDPNGKE